jgi:hypothetical protein
MSYTAVQRGPEADALMTVLSAAVLTGDGVRPDGGGFANDQSTGPFTPYIVLYSGIVPIIDGPVADPYADTVGEYQVTSVGCTASQARWAADKARAALIAAQGVTVAGRSVQLIAWTGGQPVTRDDDVVPPLFYAVDLYEVSSFPA